MNSVDFLTGLISGLISGVISSMVAQFIFRIQKPKLEISDTISKEIVNGVPEYRFKVVNNSKEYAKNIDIVVQWICDQDAPNGNLITTQPISLIRKDIKFINPYKKEDSNSTYAVRFRFNCDLEEEWKKKNNASLEVSIFCENEQNGCGKMFKRVYNNPSSIIEGSFETGKSTTIVSEKK